MLGATERAMDCLQTAFTCCFRQKRLPHDILWHGSPRSVALLIENFPRPLCPYAEFTELMYLLRQHGAKCTFLVPWDVLKQHRPKAAVHEMMRMINVEGHEVALHFRQGVCGRSNVQLRQDAVEALHYVQRVFGTSVTVVRIACPTFGAVTALESLGLTVVGDCHGSGVFSFPDDTALQQNLRMALEVATGTGKRCVRLDYMLDEI